MPKNQFIDPGLLRKPGKIEFGTIPVNQYRKTVKEELSRFSPEDMLRIYRDMALIREFETMLHQIKTANEYHGVKYNHPGPAHLSMGQEAAAVGMAYLLRRDDYIFGSHRSHGEILAKGFSAIHALPEKQCMDIMSNYFHGEVLRVVDSQKKYDRVYDLATDFLLYGTLAEIFARKNGFNRGLGGSMHAFFTPFGIYPNNAIVGGSGDIGVGAALFKKLNHKPGIVVINIGDASMGCGPVWEGISLATMDQFTKLWSGEYRGGLPLIFNFMNNQYGMGGQTQGETMGYDILARVGAGVNPDMMHAERVDGYNPLAVIDAFRRKMEVISEKRGPVLLDTLTYRYSGHSPSDASTYRTREELESWMTHDSIQWFGTELVKAKIATQEQIKALDHWVVESILHITRMATDDSLSPRLAPEIIGDFMFSNGSVDALEDRQPETLLSREDNPRLKQLKTKQRFGLDEQGKPLSKMKVYQLRDGIFEAILDRFYKDPTMVAYGEENRDWGGAFAVYRGLTEALPYHRLFNTSISEGAIVGSAIGYGMSGGRVVAEIMYADFLGRAGDETFNQLPKWQAMSGQTLRMPVVIRVSVGSKYGAQHSQDWSSLLAHIPGLKVVYPATPYDAKGLMNSALQGTDPVVYFESQRIYDVGEYFHREGVPEGYYEIPLGEPDIKREGNDITILSVGPALYTAIDAAILLEKNHGLSAEVIDARSLVPFNYDMVLRSIKKTGRIILVSDASQRGSFLNDLAQNICEMAFDSLDAPPVVVGARNWIVPAHEMESFFFPQKEWIVDAIHEKIVPLKGHKVFTNQSISEQMRRARKGV
jgi:2-oxoisovalerate dehydrogenase E1 component